MTREEKVAAVYRLFEWANHLGATGGDATIEDIRGIFAAHSPMHLNGRAICHDHATHLQHALDLQRGMSKWRFNIPFERVIVEGDQVVGYYTVDYEDPAGRPGRMLDMCIFTVAEDRIAGILEHVVFEGQELAIESFEA